MRILLQMTVIKLNSLLCEDKDWKTAAYDFSSQYWCMQNNLQNSLKL